MVNTIDLYLVNRGDITPWLSDDVIQAWNDCSAQTFGRPKLYSSLAIDSTGLSIHGEGRWTRHKHGKRKRRGWRKLHIGVSDGLIVASHLTNERVPDGNIAPDLIKQ